MMFLRPLLIAAAILATLVAVYALGRTDGRERAEAKHTAQLLKQRLQDETQARQTQTQLQEQLDAASKDHAHEISRIRRSHDAALASLRNRPTRPAPAPAGVPAPASPAAAASGCTGAELYRPDGEFLAGETARAEILRAEVRACRAAYERASK
jgi:hypothetical protein